MRLDHGRDIGIGTRLCVAIGPLLRIFPLFAWEVPTCVL